LHGVQFISFVIMGTPNGRTIVNLMDDRKTITFCTWSDIDSGFDEIYKNRRNMGKIVCTVHKFKDSWS